MSQTRQRWLTAIPLPYSEAPGWWEREAGALCLGFREIGVDARFVVLGEPRPNVEPFLLACRGDMESAEWWNAQAAVGVVLYSWGAPRHEPIARAIAKSGTKLLLRMDTDGTNSPRVDFARYFEIERFRMKDFGRKVATLQAFAKAFVFRWWPAAYDTRFAEHLDHAQLVVVESPIAEQRIRRLLLKLGADRCAEKLWMQPPQISPRFAFDSSVPKKRQICAVGRWDTWQKDAPMLIRSLAQVLARDKECTAVAAGAGEKLLETLCGKLPQEVRHRIQFAGRLPHDQLLNMYRESLSLFFPSRFEGFPNAALEALCSGCSVVGPAIIASMNYCTHPSCGTVACKRTPEDFADALLAELGCWDRGERDPAAFSRWWQQRVWAPNVARRIIDEVQRARHL